jgi:F0F1-type ATP synthase assembly protein I
MLLDPGNRNDLNRYLAYSQVGLEIVAPVGLGVLIDLHYNILPWATTIGAVLGFVGGLYHLVKISNADNRPATPPESPSRQEPENR